MIIKNSEELLSFSWAGLVLIRKDGIVKESRIVGLIWMMIHIVGLMRIRMGWIEGFGVIVKELMAGVFRKGWYGLLD